MVDGHDLLDLRHILLILSGPTILYQLAQEYSPQHYWSWYML